MIILGNWQFGGHLSLSRCFKEEKPQKQAKQKKSKSPQSECKTNLFLSLFFKRSVISKQLKDNNPYPYLKIPTVEKLPKKLHSLMISY